MILGVLLWRLNSQISIYAYSVSGWISTAFSLFTRMLAGFKRGTNNRFLLWLDKLERPIFFSYHGMAVQLAIAMHEWERERQYHHHVIQVQKVKHQNLTPFVSSLYIFMWSSSSFYLYTCVYRAYIHASKFIDKMGNISQSSVCSLY